MKSPITVRINGSLLKTVVVIVFVFIYLAMIAHGIETKHPFLKTLTDLAQIMGVLAGFIAAYTALIGVNSWKDSGKYNRIIEFKKNMLNCQRHFETAADLNMLIKQKANRISTNTDEVTTPPPSSSQDKLKLKEQQIIELLNDMRAEASTIDLLCQDRGHNKNLALDQLVRELSSSIYKCFNFSKKNNRFAEYESGVSMAIERISHQIEIYENNI